jgi:hypothetical protein
MKTLYISAAVAALAIGASGGILAGYLLVVPSGGLDGQWQQYLRFCRHFDTASFRVKL